VLKQSRKKNPEFNKWSIELAGGFNKPQRPMSVAARTAVVSPYVADLGVRYMFNKFGIKADFGYNSFTNGDDSKVLILKYYRADYKLLQT
jgi:OOP family OmpA-OmpF porin